MTNHQFVFAAKMRSSCVYVTFNLISLYSESCFYNVSAYLTTLYISMVSLF